MTDPVVVDSLIQQRGPGRRRGLRRLSAPEGEVLAEVPAGKSNAAIACSLKLTKRAVEHHIGAIFSKLDLPDEEGASRRVLATLWYLADRQTSPGEDRW